MSGAECGIRAASAGDQGPETKFTTIDFAARSARKASMSSGVMTSSPSEGPVGRVASCVLQDQVRSRFGRVTRLRTA